MPNVTLIPYIVTGNGRTPSDAAGDTVKLVCDAGMHSSVGTGEQNVTCQSTGWNTSASNGCYYGELIKLYYFISTQWVDW